MKRCLLPSAFVALIAVLFWWPRTTEAVQCTMRSRNNCQTGVVWFDDGMGYGVGCYESTLGGTRANNPLPMETRNCVPDPDKQCGDQYVIWYDDVDDSYHPYPGTISHGTCGGSTIKAEIGTPVSSQN